MTTMTTIWNRLVPQRGALALLDPADEEVWSDRLRFDRERASLHQSQELAAITEAVEERARSAGAAAVVLSGSTARGRRTSVSDLDYHVIGIPSLQVADLPEDIDLYADELNRFWAKLRDGDDFAHWSVWYGCVLFDSGVMREAARYVADRDLWPDPERKFRQARAALDFAEKMLASGDYEAALEQVRGALSLTARWLLLSHDVFPLARDELPGQLEQLGRADLARPLRRSILEHPSAEDLRDAVLLARGISEGMRLPSGRAAA
jgi:predicted nucleotidyltransferase